MFKPFEKVAPWKDFNGKEIREGDVLEYPSGQRCIVQYDIRVDDPEKRWTVKCMNGSVEMFGQDTVTAGQVILIQKDKQHDR